jgi:pre-mRNA-splicing factor CWC22
MILDYYVEQPAYRRYFGSLGQRLCSLNKEYIGHIREVFHNQYESNHSLENMKLRNITNFFVNLFDADN